jgi:hypothetical protein
MHVPGPSINAVPTGDAQQGSELHPGFRSTLFLLTRLAFQAAWLDPGRGTVPCRFTLVLRRAARRSDAALQARRPTI